MKKIITKTLKNTEIVEKSNFFNELVCNSMTLQELRFFSIYMAKINARDESSRIVTFTLQDFRKIMELKAVYPYYIKDVFNKLLCKVVTIGNNKSGFSMFQIFKKCELVQENEEWLVKIDAHDDALPLMFKLQGKYFKYQLWNALQLKSLNQLRMYEILKQYEKIGKRTVEIDDLRNWLGIEKTEYTRWNNFKMRVLDSCQKALLEYTDIGYNYNVIKKGKGGKVRAVEFIIYKNENYKDKLQLNEFIERQPEEEDYLMVQREPKYVEYLNRISNLLGVVHLDISYFDVIYNAVRSVEFPVETDFYEENYKNNNLSESPFYYFLRDMVNVFLKNTGKKEISSKSDFNLFYNYIQDKLNTLNYDYSAYLKPQKKKEDVLDGQISLDDILAENKKYSSSYIEFLAEACEYEFSDEEMLRINNSCVGKKIPEKSSDPESNVYLYLQDMYLKLKIQAKKTNIPNRFSYLIAMIKNDKGE